MEKEFFIKSFFTFKENLALLKNGHPHQNRVFQEKYLISFLKSHVEQTFILCGTYPLGLTLQQSDFDIITQVSNLKSYYQDLTHFFQARDKFKIWEKENPKAIVCQFMGEKAPIEIFASEQKPFSNAACVHLVCEFRLMQLLSKKLQREILKQKQSGLKTEPAFAKILGIQENPYQKLYELAFAPKEALIQIASLSDL